MYGCPLQHGFSKDNLKELLFATQQLSRENEVASSKYAEVVDQIFQEFHDQVDSNIFQAEQEVGETGFSSLTSYFTPSCGCVLCRCSEWHLMSLMLSRHGRKTS